MRRFGWMAAAALAAALMTAQPVMAEIVEVPALTQQAGANESQGPAGWVEEMAVSEGAAAQSSPEQSVDASHQAPPGDEGTVLSPVIVAGQSMEEARQQAEAAASAGSPAAGTESPAIGAEGPAASEEAAANAGETLSRVIVAGAGSQATDDAAAGAAGQPQDETSGGASQETADGVTAPSQDEAADQAAAEAAAQEEAAAADAAAQQTSGRQIDPSRPMVALTFDDGPQPSVGNRIMDCLAQYGGKATFFLVGDRVGSHAAEVQRMVAEGHEVANHTMNHKYLQKLGAAEIQAQVNGCNDAIQAVCGVRPTLMRLPGGNNNATVRANVHMPMIQWNIDTLDWKTRNADQTVAAVLNHVSDGDIVLMHELYSQTGDAALRIIPELAARGYQMVTVSEMAAAKGRSLEAGQIYSSFK